MGIYDFDKNDKVVRFAILIEYDYADQYNNNNRLNMNTLTIDHIIAESKAQNKLEFDDVKKKFDLDNDFNINSLLNYLPTIFSINNEKSSHYFSVYQMDLALKRAKTKAPKILSRIQNLKKQRNTDKLVAQLFGVLKTDEDFENVAKQLFERENIIKSEKSELSYTNCKANVELNAFAPDINKYFSGFIIEFNKYNISGIRLTPSYDFLINSLFAKINHNYKKRDFVRGYNDKNFTYFVGIGDCSFNIEENCLKDFCDIIDDFYIWYTDRLIEIEKGKETLNAILFAKKCYLFASVSIHVWNDIQNYIEDYVTINGDLNGFEFNSYFIKVWNGKEGYGLHLCLHSTVYNDIVYITWNEEYLQDKGYWSYGKALNWFHNTLLPEVEKHMKKDNKYVIKRFLNFNDKKSVTNKHSIVKGNNYDVYIEYTSLISNLDFLKIIKQLESFYLIPRYLILDDNALTMLFRAMILLISKLTENMAEYLKGNLSFISKRNMYDKIKNNVDLIKALENEIKEIVNSNRLIYSLELVFRNIKVCTEYCCSSLSEFEMKLILDELQPLIDYFNRRKTLEKFNHLKKDEIISH